MKLVPHLVLPLLATLATPALAQNESIAQVVETLKLTHYEIEPDPKGPDARGRLPHGGWIALDFHRDGTLEEIEADHDAPVPVSEVSAVLPGFVLGSENWPADAAFEKIEFDHGKIEFEGRDSDGRWFKAEWTEAGRLKDWKYD